MFIGKHLASLDPQNRISLPTGIGARLEDGAFVMQGFERNLILMTPGAFAALFDGMRTMNITDPMARQLKRLLLGSAAEVRPDGKGRLALPAHLCTFAGLEGEACLIGQGDYLEIWAPAGWQAQETGLQDPQSDAGRFAALPLATS